MKYLLTIPIVIISYFTSKAQSVGIGTSTPNSSAQLDVSSTNKGFLPPRMTTMERDLSTTPAEGLIIFNINTNSLQLYNSSGWVSLSTPTTAAVFLPTIVIGTQQWMSKNLDVAFYRNGDPIPQVTDTNEWNNTFTGAWCYYNNDSTIGNKYGKLYNWYAVNDPRGLAPQGWHIPSDTEWTILETTLGGLQAAGGKMKEAGTQNWTSPNTDGNNNSGFAGLPGGYRSHYGFFGYGGTNGYWWSSSLWLIPSWAIYRGLDYSIGNLGHGYNYKLYGFSVRCLRD